MASSLATRRGPSEPSAPSLVDRLLEPISPTLGLRLIPGDGDPFYLQNRGTEQYLFRDEHSRWVILQPSADRSDEFVRWVYLPNDKPQTVARTAIRQRTVIGYDYVRQTDAPDPAHSTVTAMFVADRRPDTSVNCGSCGASFETTGNHALHCWGAHPWVPKPAQVRRRPDDE